MKIIRKFGKLFIGASLRKIFSMDTYTNLFKNDGFNLPVRIKISNNSRDYKETNFSTGILYVDNKEIKFRSIEYFEVDNLFKIIDENNKEITLHSNKSFHLYVKITKPNNSSLCFIPELQNYIVNFYIDEVEDTIKTELISEWDIDEIYSI